MRLKKAIFNFFIEFFFLSVIEQLDAKTTIMSMLSHDDTNVRHQALLCVQKLMVHHWEYLTKLDLNEAPSSQANKTVGTKA